MSCWYGNRSEDRIRLCLMRVPLSLACGAYDRIFALARGDIQPAAEIREAYVI